MSEDELQRICDQAGIAATPTELHPLGFRDRHGTVHLLLDGMARLAMAVAAAEPQAVNRYIDDREEELRLRGCSPAKPRVWCGV